MKKIRQLHLWLGTLFAPAIIFFAFSGVLQTFGLHESPRGSSVKRPPWIAKIAEVHIHQQWGEPPRKGAPPAPAPAEVKAPAPAPQPGPAPGSKLPFQIFMLMMAAGLIFTTLIGLYMAFKYNRDRRVVWGLLVAGVAVPVVLLLLK